MLKIKLGRLKHDTGYRQELDIQAFCDTAAYAYPELVLAKPLHFGGYAENFGGEIKVQGQLTAYITQICSCCCTSFVLKQELDFAEIYSAQGETPDINGEQDTHSFSGDEIDITPEALRLSFAQIPMKPLCKQDCAGLSYNDNRQETDPRWDKLRDLLPDDFGKGV